MATQLRCKEDIPKIIAEMTLEEKADMLTGASNYGTCGMEKYGIPALKLIDNGAGVNLRQYAQELVSRGEVDAVDNSGTPVESSMSFIMDHVDDRAALSKSENELLDRVLAYLKKTYVPSGELPDCFPVGSLLASTWCPEAVLGVAEEVGKEASAYGLDVLLGTPCVNIQRDPLGGRNFECWSEDPYLTGEMAKNYAVGVQKSGVIADLKHFAVNNQETRRRTVSAEISERALREIYLPAFKKVVQEGGVKTVMTSYNSINGTPASENEHLIEEILRGEWGFQGLVMSDWGGVYHRGASMAAGNDLCMPHRFPGSALAEDVKNGLCSEDKLDKALVNMLTMVLDSPAMKGRRYTDITPEMAAACRKAAYRAAAEGIILLKNDDKTLPLSEEAEVSFYGSLSGRFLDCGVGSGRVHTDKTSSLLESAKAIAGSKVLFETVTAQTKAVVVTISARGQEGADRFGMEPEPQAEADLKKAAAAAESVGAKLIVILNIAGPVDLGCYQKAADAILCTYFPGEEGAHAAADILYGRLNPSGKLAQTYPKRYIDCPTAINFPGEYTKVDYGEGIYVGYRYFDKKQIEPLYPFGYGLSYTGFAFDQMKLESERWDVTEKDSLDVSVRVTNTGDRDGAEVVQLYLADVKSTQPKPVRELKGFRKVFLKAGESRTVTITLKKDEIASYDETYGWVNEPGLYSVELGNSSRNILCRKEFRLAGPNPYGYGRKSCYLFMLRDPRAVAALNEALPLPLLTPEELARETNYLEMSVTLNGGFKRFMKKQLPPMTEEEEEALLEKLGAAVAKVDCTEMEQKYEEGYVD